jgi:hypothetical protein
MISSNFEDLEVAPISPNASQPQECISQKSDAVVLERSIA